MAAPYVTGAEILAHVAGGNTPSADAGDVTWAAKCAAAIEEVVSGYLNGSTPSAGLEARITVAAEADGAALYQSRKAPHGVLSFGPDGEAVRLGASDHRALAALFGPGIG